MLKPPNSRRARLGLLALGLPLAGAATPAMAASAFAMAAPAVATPAPEPSPALSLPFEQAVFAGLPPREPWLAAGLSLALTGTGQFYNRESTKGFWLFGTLATYPIAMAIDAWTGSGYARVSAFSLMVAAKGYSVWDAYRTAEASASATP